MTDNEAIIFQVNFEILFKDEHGYYKNPTPRYLKRVMDGLLNKPVDFNIEKLNEWSKRSFNFCVTPGATFKDLLEEIRVQLSFNKSICNCTNILTIRTDKYFITIENYDLQVISFVEEFGIGKTLSTCLVFSKYQGVIDQEDNLRYYMYSNESGSHNLPHVHVFAEKDYSASIDILTGNLLSGELPGKYYRKALSRIEENRQYFLDCWNHKTNGLSFDLDYGLQSRSII